MDIPRLLSGDELVARGLTKLDATLPEIGVKDVVPNGSWLEQKQIQSALEARKHIIEVERIEKSGVLSHAEWREDLMLAEVSRNTGGHWQYIGHHIGKELYLKPEEALFLIEVNCLKLTYNGLTVSLQQAYSLLLRSKISILQYKVYASLSRIGYKVYRHEDKKLTENANNSKQVESPKKEVHLREEIEEVKVEKSKEENEREVNGATSESACGKTNECDEETEKEDDVSQNSETLDREVKINGATNNSTLMEVDSGVREVKKNGETNDSTLMEVDGGVNGIAEVCDNNIESLKINANEPDDTIETHRAEERMIIDDISSTENESNTPANMENANEENTTENKLNSTSNDAEVTSKDTIILKNDYGTDVSYENNADVKCIQGESSKSSEPNNGPDLYYQHKINMLQNRKLRPLDVKNTEKCFEKVPDVAQKQVVTVDVPEETYLPRNVFLNNISYVLNLESIKTKSRPRSNDSRAYVTNEDVNGEHIKRIKGATGSNTPVTNHPPLFPNNRFNRPNFHSFWRPNMNFFPFNFMFQRPFMPINFMPRYRVFSPRPPLLGMYPRFSSFQPNEHRSVPNENKKRRNSAQQKEIHMDAIKNLASRLRQLIQSGNTQQHNIDSLQRLINTFNTKYDMRLRLTENFEVFNDETIVETISLDEDEEPSPKRAKTDDDDKYKENLKKLKQLALKLKGLEYKEEVNSRHRRAFSKLVKKFNKAYNADVYFNSDYEIIDKKFINLDSSSDSDCVIEETAKVTGRKKLKNPFNILKRLSEKRIPSASSNTEKEGTKVKELKNKNYSKTTIESFDKNWLPSEDDFGRAEVLSKTLMNSYLLHSKKEEYIYEFVKSQPYEFDNWVDIKLSFLKSIEETNIMIENDITEFTSINPLVGQDDCTDMPAVLKKLSIIRSNKEIDAEPSLKIDFDVYNRDVQNFKKSNRPKPHFRVICISETSSFPHGKDVASLHSKYDDNVTIVFAIVGVGSISYLQINPIDLPVYIPSSDLD